MEKIRTQNLPRDVFTHLLMMASLYASVGALVALLFQYINAAFPDALGMYYQGILDAIRRSEAILIIAFPLYLLLAWMTERGIARSPAMRDFMLRKWLVYLTLFVSAVTMMIDLVVLVYNFLGGDLTLPFILKVCAVFVSAAPVFAYYLWDVRREYGASLVPRASAALAALAVLIALGAGLFIVGSPQTQRDRRFDLERIGNLQMIQNQIVNYWTSKQKLPDSLAGLQDDISGFSAPADPVAGTAYEYRATGGLSFELCASFATEGGRWEDSYFPPSAPAAIPRALYGGKTPASKQSDNWHHAKGRACFLRTIDPDLYRPQKPFPL